jgi:uncharacterized membrane protein
MKPSQRELYIHRIFDVSLVLKGIHAVLETIAGFVVLFVSQDFVVNVILSITSDEVSTDPKDFINNYLLSFAESFSVSSQHFIAFYLLSHGIIKAFLVTALFKEKLWSYPLAMAIFSLFGIYQIFEFTRTGSAWLLALTVLDVFIILLTLHEYRYMKKTGIKPKWSDPETKIG